MYSPPYQHWPRKLLFPPPFSPLETSSWTLPVRPEIHAEEWPDDRHYDHQHQNQLVGLPADQHLPHQPGNSCCGRELRHLGRFHAVRPGVSLLRPDSYRHCSQEPSIGLSEWHRRNRSQRFADESFVRQSGDRGAQRAFDRDRDQQSESCAEHHEHFHQSFRLHRHHELSCQPKPAGGRSQLQCLRFLHTLSRRNPNRHAHHHR